MKDVTTLRVGLGIHTTDPNGWGWEVSSETNGYSWGVVESECDAYREAAIKLNELLSLKGFIEPAANSQADQDFKAAVKRDALGMLDGMSVSDFSGFEAFHNWVETTLHYEDADTQDDSGVSGIASRELYEEIYDELVADEKLSQSSTSTPRMR